MVSRTCTENNKQTESDKILSRQRHVVQPQQRETIYSTIQMNCLAGNDVLGVIHFQCFSRGSFHCTSYVNNYRAIGCAFKMVRTDENRFILASQSVHFSMAQSCVRFEGKNEFRAFFLCVRKCLFSFLQWNSWSFTHESLPNKSMRWKMPCEKSDGAEKGAAYCFVYLVIFDANGKLHMKAN